MEEVGLVVGNVKSLGIYEDDEPDKNREMTHYVFNMFKAETSGGESTSEEFPEIKWIEKTKLNDAKLARPSIKLFKDLGYL